ncbi:hypothetical protein BpHYR1_034871, partial [Brachionus plicatilis]
NKKIMILKLFLVSEFLLRTTVEDEGIVEFRFLVVDSSGFEVEQESEVVSGFCCFDEGLATLLGLMLFPRLRAKHSVGLKEALKLYYIYVINKSVLWNEATIKRKKVSYTRTSFNTPLVSLTFEHKILHYSTNLFLWFYQNLREFTKILINLPEFRNTKIIEISAKITAAIPMAIYSFKEKNCPLSSATVVLESNVFFDAGSSDDEVLEIDLAGLKQNDLMLD